MHAYTHACIRLYVRTYITLHCITLHYIKITLHCRTFRIGQASQAFQEEIAQWRQKHPGKKRPRYFLWVPPPHRRVPRTWCRRERDFERIAVGAFGAWLSTSHRKFERCAARWLFPALGEIKKNVYMLMETRLGRAKPWSKAFNSVLRPMFVCNSQDMSGPKSLWQALKNSMGFGSCWRNLWRHNLEQEIQRIVVWPSTCWTLSKVSCSDTTVGANSGVSLASWRKKTCDFCLQMTVKIHGKHSQNKKRVCRLAPAMRISNRNLDTSDKNALNSTICLQSRWRKGAFSLGSLTTLFKSNSRTSELRTASPSWWTFGSILYGGFLKWGYPQIIHL